MFAGNEKETYKVVKQGRTWAIVIWETGEVVEGGFFSKEFAEEARVEHENGER